MGHELPGSAEDRNAKKASAESAADPSKGDVQGARGVVDPSAPATGLPSGRDLSGRDVSERIVDGKKAAADQSVADSPMTAADSNDPTDEALMLRLVAGDRTAHDLLMERHSRGVSRTIARYIHNPPDQEDCGQKTWMRVYQKAGSFRTRGSNSYKSLLYTIAHNVCLDLLRQRNGINRYETTDSDATPADAERTVVESAADPRPAPEWADLKGVLNFSAAVDCMRQLPDELREVVIFHAGEEIGFEDLADLLDSPMGTVFDRYRRGLRSIQWCLKQQGRRLGPLSIRRAADDKRFDVDLIDINAANHSYDLVVWGRDPGLLNTTVDVALLSLPSAPVLTVQLKKRTAGDIPFGDKRLTGQTDIANSRTELLVSITVH